MKSEKLDKAEYILCTGLFDEKNNDLKFYKELLEKKYKYENDLYKSRFNC